MEAPLLTDLGLAAFIIYATVRAFCGQPYWVDDYHYLTPFYSPCISSSCAPGASHLGVWFGHFPWWIPLRQPGAAVLARFPVDLLLLPQGLLPGGLALAARAARWPNRTRRTPARPASR